MTNVLLTQGSWTDVIARRLALMGAQVAVLVNPQRLNSAYAWADRVLIPGGSDIHPDWYNQPLTHARPYSPERDLIEYDLADRCLREGKPLMGICRGHQMICVAAGGALHQDIKACTGIPHAKPDHALRVLARSQLARHVGAGLRTVNSYHHQAVSEMPQGWRVAATSDNGRVVEAIEHSDLPVVSVQWHPEVLYDSASFRLFAAFLNLPSPF